MRKLIPGLTGLLLAAGFSIWAYPQLPEQVATHFNLHGEPNGWSSRTLATWLIPVLGLAVALVFLVLPKIDPRGANYAKFGSTYWTIVNAVLIFLAGLHAVTLGKALGWNVSINRVLAVAMGALFVLLGSLMTRIQPNWFVGIRTPWTLSSDTVWRKTHQFGGTVFVLAGVCVFVAAFLPATWEVYVLVTAIVVASLATVVYSYLVWREEQKGGSAAAR